MKNLKTILSLFAIAAVFSTSAFAQAVSDEVTATAEVLATLGIDFTGNDVLAFGGINLPSIGNTTVTVAADGSANSNAGAEASPAVGAITGGDGASIVVSYTTGVVMEDGSSNDLAVTPDVFLENDDTSASQTIAQTGTSTVIDTDGESSITVGGDITVSNTTTAGSYSTATGSGVALTITVQYN